MLVAAVGVIALATRSEDPSTGLAVVASRLSLKNEKHALSKLIGEGIAEQFANTTAAAQNFVPNTDKIHFPSSWESFQTTFGAHLTWALIVLFFAAITWVYVRFIRPQSWFKDLLRAASESATLPVNVGDTLGKVPTDLDENDIVSTLVLVPGEAVFFNEEASNKAIGTVYKLSVTNLRIIAQKAETTMFGTCQVICIARPRDIGFCPFSQIFCTQEAVPPSSSTLRVPLPSPVTRALCATDAR